MLREKWKTACFVLRIYFFLYIWVHIYIYVYINIYTYTYIDRYEINKSSIQFKSISLGMFSSTCLSRPADNINKIQVRNSPEHFEQNGSTKTHVKVFCMGPLPAESSTQQQQEALRVWCTRSWRPRAFSPFFAWRLQRPSLFQGDIAEHQYALVKECWALKF